MHPGRPAGRFIAVNRGVIPIGVSISAASVEILVNGSIAVVVDVVVRRLLRRGGRSRRPSLQSTLVQMVIAVGVGLVNVSIAVVVDVVVNLGCARVDVRIAVIAVHGVDVAIVVNVVVGPAAAPAATAGRCKAATYYH